MAYLYLVCVPIDEIHLFNSGGFDGLRGFNILLMMFTHGMRSTTSTSTPAAMGTRLIPPGKYEILYVPKET